ncbi:DUF1127 domain-containing protein [Algirhabdus cladophorae]|uniref:DUF1127 domain-containing protein n=1 Tax=Algirhabdus cladophorae TaxID=3377108 RepID=UPI003B84AFF3
MAYMSGNPSNVSFVGAFLNTLGDRLFSAFNVAVEANGRMARVEALQALSDEQLAAKGLRREDIARHVFSDIFDV